MIKHSRRTLGKRLLDAAKKAFGKPPAYASRNAREKSLGAGQKAEYIIRTTFQGTTTRHTREEARTVKRSLRSIGYAAAITRILYDESGKILEERKEM